MSVNNRRRELLMKTRPASTSASSSASNPCRRFSKGNQIMQFQGTMKRVFSGTMVQIYMVYKDEWYWVGSYHMYHYGAWETFLRQRKDLQSRAFTRVPGADVVES